MSKKSNVSLGPDLESHSGDGPEGYHAYWMGITEDCPVNHITCGDMTFPKVVETREPDKLDPESGDMVRVPRHGAIDKRVTISRLRRLQKRLKRLVIRFVDQKPLKEEPGTGENIGDLHNRGRKGYVITIPDPDDIAEHEKQKNTKVPTYIRRPGDEPAYKYMYLHRCSSQKNPKRGQGYKTLEETGIEWPPGTRPEPEEKPVKLGTPAGFSSRQQPPKE